MLRQRVQAVRLGRAESQVAPRQRRHARRRVQSRLRPGRSRPGDPEPDQLRDLPAREAAVFPGRHRRVLVSVTGLLFAPHRRRADRADGGPGQILADVPSPATIYGAGKVVGRLGPGLDHRRAQRDHGAQPRRPSSDRGCRRRRPSRAARRAGDGVQRPAPQARARQRRPHRHSSARGLDRQPRTMSRRRFATPYLGGIDGRWRSQSADYVVSGAFVQSYIHGGPSPDDCSPMER